MQGTQVQIIASIGMKHLPAFMRMINTRFAVMHRALNCSQGEMRYVVRCELLVCGGFLFKPIDRSDTYELLLCWKSVPGEMCLTCLLLRPYANRRCSHKYKLFETMAGVRLREP